MEDNQAAAGLAIALLVLLAAIAVYDVLVAYRLLPGRPVSWVLHQWSVMHPVLPLLVGLLLGHLFWPVR